ncbi:glycosyltransferase [Laspinema sp. D1]|uniref:glycosyltransferase n=1 Tax=Laspinema palackyanum TaxID=3231601 RepID=UPI003470C02C|nr:glycosyltransferase [Laspinema sp. D2b]
MNPQPISQPMPPSFLPPVSVVVPVYNGEQDLPDLIDCLRSQTYPPQKVEYILVDNNSSDRTPILLQDAVQNTPEITLRPLSEPQIQSSYAARNTGIRAATGEFIAFTDADCRPEPNWLFSLIQPFIQENVGIVVGEIAAFPGNNILEQYAEREETLSQKHTLAHPFCPYGQTANLGIRRSIFAEVGLFRSYLTTGGDADICWRILRETEWKFEFAPNAIVKHRHRTTLKALQSQWRRYGKSNRYLHELHGIDLMRELDQREYLYRLTRWVLKELPLNTLKAVAQKATLADILSTPIGLICTQARSQGQREANLSETARKIDSL